MFNQWICNITYNITHCYIIHVILHITSPMFISLLVVSSYINIWRFPKMHPPNCIHFYVGFSMK